MIDISQEEIMQNWGEKIDNCPLVSIRCTAYNHEKYISQTIDGFLIQHTNFPFEVIVHDDASNDETASIIHEYEVKYPKIIKPIYETENQYSKHDGSLTKIMLANCKGKYLAFCEGDDYWIDRYKLQRQVDFLENHSEYGMCYTRAKRLDQLTGRIVSIFGGPYEQINDLINENRIPTLTVCLRTDIYRKYLVDVNPIDKNWLMGDYPIWLYFAENNKIKFINKITSIYRILPKSASHFSDLTSCLKFKKSTIEIQNYFINRYEKNIPLKVYDEKREIFSFWRAKKNYVEMKNALSKINNKTKIEKLFYMICSVPLLFDIYKILCSIKKYKCLYNRNLNRFNTKYYINQK